MTGLVCLIVGLMVGVLWERGRIREPEPCPWTADDEDWLEHYSIALDDDL